MEPLPDPTPSPELISFAEGAAAACGDFHDIGSMLRRREAEVGDNQAGWLMTAFDYTLARRTGDRKKAPAFGDMWTSGAGSYPTPLGDVPQEVVDLWRGVLEASGAPAIRARLAHLLFERGGPAGGRDGRIAADAYLQVGSGDWARIHRVNCLHWALDLARTVRDGALAGATLDALSAIADQSLSAESPEPGVSLHALEVLVDNAPERPELEHLLKRARQAYAKDPWNLGQTIELERDLAKGDDERRRQLRRDQVQVVLDHAATVTGIVRMAFLEDAAQLAGRFELPDLAATAIRELQSMSIEDLDLKPITASISVPIEPIDAHVAHFLDAPDLATALVMLVSGSPPTGDMARNQATAREIATEAPFASLFPTTHIGADGLPRYRATDDDDQEDEQLARVELMGLTLGGPVIARIIAEVLERFDATEVALTEVLARGVLVSDSTAAALARSFCHYRRGDVQAAAHVAVPRIETMA